MIQDSRERDPFTHLYYDRLPMRPQLQRLCVPTPLGYGAEGRGWDCRGNRDLQRPDGKEGAEEGAGGKADRQRVIERV